MAVVVVGGHSRSVGKTSVVAGLIARMPQLNWTVFKITQHDHALSTMNDAPGDRIIDIIEESDPSSGSDTARFLAAGAARSLLVRVRQGMLAEAMPRIRKELAAAHNAILESNSIMQFLRPDLYLTVLDAGTADFKDSARRYLDLADAFLMRSTERSLCWEDVSATLFAGKPQFAFNPPEYVTADIADFVRSRIASIPSSAAR